MLSVFKLEAAKFSKYTNLLPTPILIKYKGVQRESDCRVRYRYEERRESSLDAILSSLILAKSANNLAKLEDFGLYAG